jgi:hypothetical protein
LKRQAELKVIQNTRYSRDGMSAPEPPSISFSTAQGVEAFASYKFKGGAANHVNRGRALVGQVGHLVEDGDTCSATVQGSEPNPYTVFIQFAAHAGGEFDWADVACNCKAAQKQALCKHGIAVLLKRLAPSSAPTAAPPGPAPPPQPAAHREPPPAEPLPAEPLPPSQVLGGRMLPPSLGALGGATRQRQGVASQSQQSQPAGAQVAPRPKGNRWPSAQEMLEATNEELRAECDALLGPVAKKRARSEERSLAELGAAGARAGPAAGHASHPAPGVPNAAQPPAPPQPAPAAVAPAAPAPAPAAPAAAAQSAEEATAQDDALRSFSYFDIMPGSFSK